MISWIFYNPSFGILPPPTGLECEAPMEGKKHREKHREKQNNHEERKNNSICAMDMSFKY